MKQIKDIILETKKIKWVDILDLQPINLKNDYHSEKTKQSIIENGFSRAIYVWLNPDDQQTYIIDGHLRTDLLKELVNDGYDVPDMLNCTFLDLPNKQTAIKYLLQVFNQKTNPISQKALGDWFDELDLSIPELNLQIDDLHIELNEGHDLEQFTDKFELQNGEKGNLQQMTFTLSDEQVETIKDKINEFKKTEKFKYVETYGNENSNGNALYGLII